MSAKGSKKTASQLKDQRLQRLSQESQASQDSTDSLLSSQASQNSKGRAKNYSREESEALARCTEKFHTIISKNSSHDKDIAQKERAWENIKSSFDDYCKSQGIYVSSN